VLDVGARHLHLEADSAVGKLFDLCLQGAAILPAGVRPAFSLKKALLAADSISVRFNSAVSLLVALTAAVTVGLAVPPGDTADLMFFVHSAERLFSSDWASTYSDPTLQVGPLQLVLLGALDAVADLVGISSTRLIGALFGVVVIALFWLVARHLLDGRGGRWALTAAALAPVALGHTFDAYRDGHPAQAIVPLLWVLAGLELCAGRAWLAGVLIGVSAGFELWGILGVAIVVLAPRSLDALRAFAAATLVLLALLGPFALAGDFGMFEYRWEVAGDTLLSLLVEPGTAFTWPLRVLQGAMALLAGATVAWSLRRSAAALWAGPLALVAVRLALDPVRYPWYWLALETLVLVGAVHLLSGLERISVPEQRSRLVWNRSPS
jgi:hypothetical protein